MIKGVLLCGGEGTRLRPHTEVINKHLVRVGNLPMAEYPFRKMVDAGIKEIMVVSGGANFAAVVKYFGSGKKWGVTVVHAIQDDAGGIAQALGLARAFVGNSKVAVLLGDNLFSMSIKDYVKDFEDDRYAECVLFSIEVDNPREYGVLKFKDGEPFDVIEKPATPPSNSALAGMYFYGPRVFDIIQGIKPSERGELEISDVNRFYIRSKMAEVVKMDGWWCDCGRIESLLQAEERLRND